jgi:hypothetical protein
MAARKPSRQLTWKRLHCLFRPGCARMTTKAVRELVNGYEKYTHRQRTNEPDACELVTKVNTDSSQQFASRSGSQELQPYPQTVLYVARNLLALEWPAWPPPYKNPLTAWVTFPEDHLVGGRLIVPGCVTC